MRDSVRTEHGILSHPDLHPLRTDCHHFMGQLLAKQKRDTCPSRPWCHHRAYHDHAHVIHQRCAAKDFLRQINRRLLGHLFRDGVRFATRYVKLASMLFYFIAQ